MFTSDETLLPRVSKVNCVTISNSYLPRSLCNVLLPSNDLPRRSSKDGHPLKRSEVEDVVYLDFVGWGRDVLSVVVGYWLWKRTGKTGPVKTSVHEGYSVARSLSKGVVGTLIKHLVEVPQLKVAQSVCVVGGEKKRVTRTWRGKGLQELKRSNREFPSPTDKIDDKDISNLKRNEY